MQLLQHLARRLGGQRLAVFGTYRETDLDRRHPLAEVLADLRQERLYERVRLQGVGVEVIIDLLEAVLRQEDRRFPNLAQAIHRETEGNMFFIEETLRHLVETGGIVRRDGRWTSDATSIEDLSIPEGVREVVGRRLSRLSDACNDVLRDGALLGREFEFPVLEAMAGVDGDALLVLIEEAEAAQVLREVRDQTQPTYQFTHALLQQTLLEELSLPREQRAHLRAAGAIEGVHRSTIEHQITSLAEHYRLAGAVADAAKTKEYALLAEAQAERLFAWEEAHTHWLAALEVMEAQPAPVAEIAEHLERSWPLAIVASVIEFADWREYGERALDLYAELGDRFAASVRSRAVSSMFLTRSP